MKLLNINWKTVLFLFLAAASICYGIIVRQSGSGTGFFLLWLGLGVVFLLLAGYVSFFAGTFQLPKQLKRILVIIVCVLTACFAGIEGCVISQMHASGRDGLDTIIVLGAQVHRSGPSRVLRYRLDKAVEYLNENPDTICILSGGQGSNEPFAEAEGMATYMQEHGIPVQRLILEDQSETTEENLKNSSAYLEDHASVGIVTNDFHVFRALQIAKSQGMTNVCGIAAPSTRLYKVNNLVREFFAEIKFLGRSLIRKK